MALPEQISVRYTEEDAGYVSVRPVVTQNFRLHDLIDMILSAAGKDSPRVKEILEGGAVSYNGYRYWWESIPTELAEVEVLLSGFPDDDPSRVFQPANAVAAIFEMGGGSQRSVVELQRTEASAKKLFGKTTPWDALLENVLPFPARYEKYFHPRRADLFRVSLPYENAQNLLRSMKEAAPRSLRHRWGALRPPTTISFVTPRN